MTFDHSSLRWFEVSTCIATSEGLPPSLVKHSVRMINHPHAFVAHDKGPVPMSRIAEKRFGKRAKPAKFLLLCSAIQQERFYDITA